LPPCPALPTASVLAVLELDGISRRFGETIALDGLTFEVPTASVWGFVGRNGAGKTTAMRIVLGLLSADAGTVRWSGAPIDAAARKRAGYMPEERGLYPKMRVGDQLRYLARLRGLTRDDAAAATASLLDRLGIGARIDDRLEALSLGNQQRVQLAAALVHRPDLLILDEPFSGLDPVAVDALAETLAERVAEGTTVLFSSHQLELVERLCDGVAIIDRGSLVASGRVHELRERDPRRRIRVEVDAGASWAGDLDGATVVESNGPEVLLELDDGVDDQAILERARAAGQVVTFARVRPTLTQVFRAAVEE
jgi:ABC-2 type transport system ATP-binding protein